MLKLLTPSAFLPDPGPGIVLALHPTHMIDTDGGTYALLDEASPATTSYSLFLGGALLAGRLGVPLPPRDSRTSEAKTDQFSPKLYEGQTDYPKTYL